MSRDITGVRADQDRCVVKVLRAIGRLVSGLGTVLLLVSGAYVVYYWLTAGRFLLA